MRILHVLGERGYSGGEVQLAHVLEELARRGHESRMLLQASARFRGKAADLGIAVETLRMRSGFDLLAARRLRAAVRRQAPDLVHLADARTHKLGALARLAGLGPCVLATRRMDYALRRGPFSRWLYGRAVDAVIAVSEAVRHEIERVGVPRSRVHVVHDGVDPAPFADLAARRTPARARLGLAAAALVVLCAASLRPRKGQAHLVKAFAALAGRFPAARLVLAGEGSERKRLDRLVQALGLGERVLLPGRLDVRDALAAADMACVPSLKEGLSVFSLEAQAAGLPVVASRVGGLPESVAGGVTGLLVAPGDETALAAALAALLADGPLREVMGAAGRKRVAGQFTAGVMARATADLYEGLAAGTRP